ncbi:helix-turn-helix XRE-family transcriptional regulators [Candidatus Termititenax persephonae]|uniref:Helix-turn-helix XRE-family transcriptional regulators n=1 Tax=Candidatus Termititenax persephonae TaxID=2218525 RepID=A0A388TGN1_9BACT|nr:helix-turn-helix XRE-family transcriptional regulators [Candidatus Termititenax persephonae]
MTDYLMTHIGQTIRTIRQAKKLSMEETAFAAGISYFYFSQIEHGQCNLTVKVLYQVATALGVEPISLLPGGHVAPVSLGVTQKKSVVLKSLKQLMSQIREL